MSTNTEALAAQIVKLCDADTGWGIPREMLRSSAAELRRLAAVEAELREANEQFARRQVWWNDKMVALEIERDALQADFSRLMERHNNLHANAAKDRAERDALVAALRALADPKQTPSDGDPVVLRDFARNALKDHP